MLGDMASFVVRPNGILQYDMFINGKRFREGTGLPDTPANRQRMRRNVRRLNAELETGAFNYAKWFPDSKKIEAAERLLRENRSDDPGQRFGRYAWSWYAMCKGDWKPAYRTRVAHNLRGHIVPFLGDYPVDQVDERALRTFRQSLLEQTRPNGRRAFSNSRITNLMAHISAIMNLAERELGINNPIKYLPRLPDDRKDPQPLTVEQVHAFLRAVDPRMRLYFEVRFYTGLRTGEINGLRLRDLDLPRNRLRIRVALTDGMLQMLKTRRSRRNIQLAPRLGEALAAYVGERHGAGMLALLRGGVPEQPEGFNPDAVEVRDRARQRLDPDDPGDFANNPRLVVPDAANPRYPLDGLLFTDFEGQPLDPSQVSKEFWLPTLKRLGLERRRVYETRHTAAVLHLAAGENPLFVSRLLGHADSAMLFNVYAPFVPNIMGRDGEAFEALMTR
ncbi:hypothetical protein SPICUR_09235 [Spiribacter curvatus]|uniref:Tyr recombinase domain-containing protein n=2 Tax=Spiribacter curvatus TaxID=1335757 RepID=U5T8L7_9GAMM|nr:hypothetical protein SPICUR_09235 [Spiribacter curvatus]